MSATAQQHQSQREIQTLTLRRASIAPKQMGPPPAVPAPLPPPPPRPPSAMAFVSPTRFKRSATLPKNQSPPHALRELKDSIVALHPATSTNQNSKVRPESSSGLSPSASPMPGKENENMELLFSHPYSKITSFAVTASNSQWGTDQKQLLPFKNATERTIAKGSIIIYRAKPHSTAFIQSGKIFHPVMARSTCWCVEEVIGKGVWGRGRGVGVFVLRIRPGLFWRIDINEAGMNGAVEEFKHALRGVLSFEKEECPFQKVDVVIVGEDEKEKEKKDRKQEKEWILLEATIKEKEDSSTLTPSPQSRRRPRDLNLVQPEEFWVPTSLPTPNCSPGIGSFYGLLPSSMLGSDTDLSLRPHSRHKHSTARQGQLRGFPVQTPHLPTYSLGLESFDDILRTPMRTESQDNLSKLLRENTNVNFDNQESNPPSCTSSLICISSAVNASVDSLALKSLSSSQYTFSTPPTSYGMSPAAAIDHKESKRQKDPSSPSSCPKWVIPSPKATTVTTLTHLETTFVTSYETNIDLLALLGSLVPESGRLLSAAADRVIVKPSVYLAGAVRKFARRITGGVAVQARTVEAVVIEALMVADRGKAEVVVEDRGEGQDVVEPENVLNQEGESAVEVDDYGFQLYTGHGKNVIEA